MTSIPAPPPQSPADPVSTGPGDAIADLRATARWTVVAVATVGALLVGGGPLTAVGRIHDWGDTFAALGGLALTVLGVGWAIWQTGEALTPCLATLDDLDAPEMTQLRDAIARNPAAYYGPYRSLGELRSRLRLHQAVAADLAIRLSREQDPLRTKILERGLADARANAEEAQLLQHRLLALIHAWSVRNAVRRARLHTIAASGLVVLGAILFLTATSDSAAEPPAKPGPSASADSGPAPSPN
ncbi:hypothetical protein ABZ915_48550 [Streptomyces sp. NPDC046915]|uniref:hypothetical protein n=1 Tax=Streptomyces sp. NPDC046915 TaxID=3155257 RepID=UPI0033DD0626